MDASDFQKMLSRIHFCSVLRRSQFCRIYSKKMSAVSTYIATVEDIDTIMELTNDAFIADAFFKKPEYHLRFDAATVKEMIEDDNSRFVIATQNIDGVETKCGSIFLHWAVESTQSNLQVTCSIYTCMSLPAPSIPSLNKQYHPQQVTGKFSAVSVPTKFEKRGIGKTLVKAIETQLQEIAHKELAAITNDTRSPTLSVNMEMGVINQRKDLFPWYEGQGYKVIGEIKPNDAELLRICLDDFDICCILMRKQLV